MDAIRRFHKPVLRRPMAMVAFEGWNDACDAASGVIAYLLGQTEVEPFAMIEPEEFFDFQDHRPTVSIDDGGTRSLTWPATRFYAIERPDLDHDLVLVLGEEPSLRWKTYSRLITQVLCEVDVEDTILLGAFIGQVAHTREVPIFGVSTDPARVYEHGLAASTYEGPTGIVGLLLEACREAGLPTVSLWAATPHYLAANPNPPAMLALLRASAAVLGLEFDVAELNAIVEEFQAKVGEAVTKSSELADYISELEASSEADLDVPSSEGLMTEIEAFLKEQG